MPALLSPQGNEACSSFLTHLFCLFNFHSLLLWADHGIQSELCDPEAAWGAAGGATGGWQHLQQQQQQQWGEPSAPQETTRPEPLPKKIQLPEGGAGK